MATVSRNLVVNGQIGITATAAGGTTSTAYQVVANGYAIVQVGTSAQTAGSTAFYTITSPSGPILGPILVALGSITQALYLGPQQTLTITVAVGTAGTNTITATGVEFING